MMQIKYSKHWPLKNFLLINWFGTIFIREENKSLIESIKNTNTFKSWINHEKIHEEQAKDIITFKDDECIKKYFSYLLYYIIYVSEWLIKACCKLFNRKIKVYKSVSFEQEANAYETNLTYINNREKFANLKWLFKFYI